VDVGGKVARERPLPFHYYYANKASFSYPTSRDSPKPQPACGVRRPQFFAEQDGRSPPKPLAISKNLNDQPAPQLPKPMPKPDRCAAGWRKRSTAQGGQNLRVFPKPAPARM